MPISTVALREERAKLIADARALVDKSKTEERALTAEERKQYDTIWSAVCAKREAIEDAERQNDLEAAEYEQRQSQKEEEAKRKAEEGRNKPKEPAPALSPHEQYLEERRSAAYHSWFCKSLVGRTDFSEEEQRAQIAGKGEKGGYLYASEQFMNDLLKDVDNATPFRTLARRFTLMTSDSLGVPTLTSKFSDAGWTSELGVPNRDTVKFGKRALTPHPLAKECVVSKVLIRKAPDIISIVRGELARAVAEAEENAYMTGTGDQQPLGLFVAHADGIGTGQDVSTDNTSTLVKTDNLKRAKFTLNMQYWSAARWIMHPDIMGQIARLKDGNGQYLLTTSVTNGDPMERLLGFPVVLSYFAPNTTGSGNYAYALADFSNYWVVDGLDTTVERLQELYARQNQDDFIIRAMTDGAPVRAEGFVRGTFA